MSNVVISPANTRVDFTAFALGLLPIHGRFDHFSGSLILDSAHPAACSVNVRIEAASLSLPNPAMQADVLSRGFFDPQDYPAIAFQGNCVQGGLTGQLTLHGQTHPLSMHISRRRSGFVATATIRRFAWGITARPVLAGPGIVIRISVSVAGD
ncbi:MAG: YceI family protein [Acetobacteraceae bacterium]|nr:YceI family protein [Acetobacteraceae bacterium]